jgi:CheY-like chemotaxis protein
MKGNGEFEILLVDDSADDAFFVRKALEKARMGKSCKWVEDGDEAIKYPRGEGKYTNRREFPFPTVILSDLKMPRMSGFELLRWVREHPECAVIPTILFTSSAVVEDVVEAYRLGANAYMVKPSQPEEFVDILRVTCDYWTRCERPPPLHKC